MNSLAKYEQSAEFRAVLKAFDSGHDPIQLEHFVVGSGLTPYGRWRQACLETRQRYEELKRLGFDRAKREAEIDILQAEIDELHMSDSAVDAAKARLKSIEQAEKRSQIENTDHASSRILREIEIVYQLATHYRAQCDGGTPDELSEYHTERLLTMALAKLAYGNAEGPAEMAMRLPQAAGERILLAMDGFKQAQLTSSEEGKQADAVQQ
jgi:hypothetical protein